MDTVSCRAFSAVSKMARHAGVPMDELVRGLEAERLWQQEDARVSWDDWVTLFDRFEAKVPGEGQLSELACRAMLDAEGQALGAQLKEACPTARAFFEMMAKWAFPATYGPVRFEADTADDGTITFSMRIADGFKSARAWLAAFEGGLAPIPVLAGYGPVEIERLELTERRATWRVKPRSPKHTPAEPASSRILVDELMQQQAQLTDALEALLESAREYRSALEALPLLVALHHEGRVRFANAAFQETFKVPEGGVIDRHLSEFFPVDQHPLLKALLEDPQSDWKRFELGRCPADSHVVWARGGGVVTFGGKAQQLFLGADSTREAAILKRAQRSESAAGVLLDALPDLVLRLGPDLVLRDLYGGANFPEHAKLRTLGGLRLRDVQIGLGMGDGPETARVLEHAARALQTRTASSHPQTWKLANGETREYLVRYVPCADGLLLISSDRTRQLAEAQRLERAERMASSGELAAGVAAEVEAPVSLVLERLHELKGELQGDPVVEEMLEELVEASVRIRDTAARLREYSSVRPSAREPLALEPVVERAARMTANELRYRAQLQLQLEPGLRAFGDAAELEQVFVTLLTTAAQAMPEVASPETHHVWVTGWAEGGETVVSVVDDGTFVAPSELPRLFEPLAERRGRTSLGLGLALARCQRVIAAHGGSLEAHSEPGRTRVLVKLPQVTP